MLGNRVQAEPLMSSTASTPRPLRVGSRAADFWRRQSFICPDVQNPFYYHQRLPWYEWIKIIVMSVTIAPIRAIIVIVCLILAAVFACFATLCRTHKQAYQPLRGCRRALVILACCLVRFCFFVGGFMWVRVIGKPARSEECRILVAAPHTSVFDGIAVFLHVTRCPSVFSRQENDKMPIIGRLLAMTQPIMVNRSDSQSRTHTLELLRERCTSSLPWPQVLIFPEGTCTNGCCLISFKVGAFAAGLPVQPVLLKYPNRVNSTVWTAEGPRLSWQMWLTFCQIYTNVTVEYLPVYYPDESEKKDPKKYANNVKALMAERMDIPQTDHSYDDCRLMKLAAKHDLPTSSGIVEFSKLSRKLNLNYQDLEAMLTQFAAIPQPQRGRVTLVDFAAYLGLPVSRPLYDLFRLFDRDDSGTMDFREYVIGLTLISPSKNAEDAIRLTFELFDPQRQGTISKRDLTRLLTTAFGLREEEVQDILWDLMPEPENNVITADRFVEYMQMKPELVRIWSFLRSQHAAVGGGVGSGSGSTLAIAVGASSNGGGEVGVCANHNSIV